MFAARPLELGSQDPYGGRVDSYKSFDLHVCAVAHTYILFKEIKRRKLTEIETSVNLSV